MKKQVFMHWLLVVLLCSGLTVGCAKKPAPAPMNETPAETTMMPQEQVSGVAESGMQESAVGEKGMEQTMNQAEALSGLNRIHFDFDQFTLSSTARDILAANAAVINAAPGLKLRIEGHCDERGSDEYNLALGEKRAQAARDYLISLGVSADRLSTISYGEEMPLDPASNEEAWAKNRRAEFKAIR